MFTAFSNGVLKGYTAIAARGMNGFPANFLDFLNILHQRYGVPKAVIEDERYIRQDIKHTKTVEVFDIDDRAMYL